MKHIFLKCMLKCRFNLGMGTTIFYIFVLSPKLIGTFKRINKFWGKLLILFHILFHAWWFSLKQVFLADQASTAPNVPCSLVVQAPYSSVSLSLNQIILSISARQYLGALYSKTREGIYVFVLRFLIEKQSKVNIGWKINIFKNLQIVCKMLEIFTIFNQIFFKKEIYAGLISMSFFLSLIFIIIISLKNS